MFCFLVVNNRTALLSKHCWRTLLEIFSYSEVTGSEVALVLLTYIEVEWRCSQVPVYLGCLPWT